MTDAIEHCRHMRGDFFEFVRLGIYVVGIEIR